MEINFFAIVLSSVLVMVIGGFWYGPLFGKKWAEIIGTDMSDPELRKKMQREATPLYIVQFLLTLFQVTVFAYLLKFIDPFIDLTSTLTIWVSSALVIWAAFVVPIIASSVMWNNDSRKISWARFLIQAGYQLVAFLVFGVILGLWR